MKHNITSVVMWFLNYNHSSADSTVQSPADPTSNNQVSQRSTFRLNK